MSLVNRSSDIHHHSTRHCKDLKLPTKGHECKATRKVSRRVRLRFASCLSIKRYRPKWCGDCTDSTCLPELSSTLKVPMLCRQPEDTMEDVTQGGDLWAPVDRQLTPAYYHPINVQVKYSV
ncbi:hypothetical protein GE061_004795 [Apolygus lucorum]|uniref:Uncharacterized protein n=1 Tax=Apolygus lucorum TaxID=248454 RepID=A0A8S9X2T7_APOLU|nr:hypothetical protein GE061_004795 [Apolygus lucorum]